VADGKIPRKASTHTPKTDFTSHTIGRSNTEKDILYKRKSASVYLKSEQEDPPGTKKPRLEFTRKDKTVVWTSTSTSKRQITAVRTLTSK